MAATETLMLATVLLCSHSHQFLKGHSQVLSNTPWLYTTTARFVLWKV